MRITVTLGIVFIALSLCHRLSAEGTAQLGVNQAVFETTQVTVDVLSATEVINIYVGDDGGRKDVPDVDGDADTAEVIERCSIDVRVYDSAMTEIGGGAISSASAAGWVEPPSRQDVDVAPLVTADFTMPPLQITPGAAGTYTITLDNLCDFSNAAYQGNEALIYPFDVTVTAAATDPIDPSSPPGGKGRVHSKRWQLNAGGFGIADATNAEFFVLVPTSANTDYTWLLSFDGMAGFFYDVTGNNVGLDAPHSGYSEDEQNTGTPDPLYEIYLNVPAVAKGGGSLEPTINGLSFAGPHDVCTCAIDPLDAAFTFNTDIDGVYEVIVDTNVDGVFDSNTDVFLKGSATVGVNTVTWDGRDQAGALVTPGTYNVQLAVRLGEFHFVGRDIETSNPGLRIFGFDPPEVNTVPSAAQMFWNDTRINTTLSTAISDPAIEVPANQKIAPESTWDMGGLSSGSYADPTKCTIALDPNGANFAATESEVNAHCWGSFDVTSGSEPYSPGNHRLIDTYVFFRQTVATTIACVWDAAADADGDGLTNGQECGSDNPTDPLTQDADGDGISDANELGGTTVTDPNSSDSDGDGIPDGVEDKNRDGNLDAGETDPSNTDSDADGLADGIEDANKDGIVGEGETDATFSDTDGDGLADGIEDANKDGVRDAQETDPKLADTDGDGLNDGVEDVNQNGVKEPTESDPLNPDSDADGLTDGEEDTNKNGMTDADETSALNADTDGDTLSDALERGKNASGNAIPNANPTNPLSADSDNDGLADAAEDISLDGVRNPTETDPNTADTDQDGLLDGIEKGRNTAGMPIPTPALTDPLNPDTDGDGLNDGAEDVNKNGKFEVTLETDPKNPDTDKDGLNDGAEDKNKNSVVDANETDPKKWDSDGGGESDGSEVLTTKNDPFNPADDRPADLALLGGGCGCVAVVGVQPPNSVWPVMILLGLLLLMRRLRRPVTVRIRKKGGER